MYKCLNDLHSKILMDLKDYVCDIVNILILTRCDLTSESKVLTPRLRNSSQQSGEQEVVEI